jgi:hypothetical protein
MQYLKKYSEEGDVALVCHGYDHIMDFTKRFVAQYGDSIEQHSYECIQFKNGKKLFIHNARVTNISGFIYNIIPNDPIYKKGSRFAAVVVDDFDGTFNVGTIAHYSDRFLVTTNHPSRFRIRSLSLVVMGVIDRCKMLIEYDHEQGLKEGLLTQEQVEKFKKFKTEKQFEDGYGPWEFFPKPSSNEQLLNFATTTELDGVTEYDEFKERASKRHFR